MILLATMLLLLLIYAVLTEMLLLIYSVFPELLLMIKIDDLNTMFVSLLFGLVMVRLLVAVYHLPLLLQLQETLVPLMVLLMVILLLLGASLAVCQVFRGYLIVRLMLLVMLMQMKSLASATSLLLIFLAPPKFLSGWNSQYSRHVLSSRALAIVHSHGISASNSHTQREVFHET